MRVPTDFTHLKLNISNHMSLSFENDGFSPLVGKIFAYLLFSPAPVSLQQMAADLGVTKAAISVQVRTLERHSMCYKLPTSNDRKDYYYIADDFCMTGVKSSIEKLRRIQQQIEFTLKVFATIAEVDEQEKPSYDACKRRFIEMQALYEIFLKRLDGLEEEWDERKKTLFLS